MNNRSNIFKYTYLLSVSSLHKKMKFSIKDSVYVTKFSADLVTCTVEIFNGKLHCLCSACFIFAGKYQLRCLMKVLRLGVMLKTSQVIL